VPPLVRILIGLAVGLLVMLVARGLGMAGRVVGFSGAVAGCLVAGGLLFLAERAGEVRQG
jgi:hypothetical protein